MRDALGNVGTGALKVNRLDNTPPTVTNVISALDGTGHRAKLTATYHDEHATLGEGSGVAELAVSKVNDASSLTWKHKDDAMFVTQAGTYFVFAKDAAGNVSTGYPVDVTINDYVVKATFVSGTDGRELPDEVRNALPSDQTGLSIGETVNPPMSVGTTVVEHCKSMELGEWTLAGWDKDSVTVTGDGQYFSAHGPSSPIRRWCPMHMSAERKTACCLPACSRLPTAHTAWARMLRPACLRQCMTKSTRA